MTKSKHLLKHTPAIARASRVISLEVREKTRTCKQNRKASRDTASGVVLSQRLLSTTRCIHACPMRRRIMMFATLSCLRLSLPWRSGDTPGVELEGADQPFLVWAEFRNLEHINTTKRLNARQSLSSLLGPAPRTANQMLCPTSLKRGDSDYNEEVNDHHIISPIPQNLEDKVRNAPHVTTLPHGCPVGRLFVPASLRQQVLRWGP